MDVNILNSLQVFVASFSIASDLLSQWRGYNGGKGYSVGINYQWLAESSRMSGFSLAAVFYDEKKQIAAVESRIDELITLSAPTTAENCGQNIQFWYQLVFQTLAYCKHPSFAEEQEYRAVRITTGWPAGVKTRAANTGLIPYLPMLLNSEKRYNPQNHENNLGFEHIIVGPALHERQIRAVDAMLAPMKMRFLVTKSVIPFVTE